jgi:hypothetical protein
MYICLHGLKNGFIILAQKKDIPRLIFKLINRLFICITYSKGLVDAMDKVICVR